MKAIAFPLLIASSLLLGARLPAAEFKLSGTNTVVKFIGTKKDGHHLGSFPKLTGTLSVNGDATQAKLQVTIDVGSITTDTEKLTAHLKSPDFFDAKRFPEARFVSTGIKPAKEGYLVTGDLTMHGKTHAISFPARIDFVNNVPTVVCEFILNRSEWDITYGKDKVNEEVQMTIEVKGK